MSSNESHIQFEAKKDGMRQNQDGLLRITFAVHPQDVDPRLLSAPMGKRFQIVMVDQDALEAAKAQVEAESAQQPQKDTLTQQAAIASNDPEFIAYLRKSMPQISAQTNDGAELVRKACGVTSRREIKMGTAAGQKWQQIQNGFTASKYGVA